MSEYYQYIPFESSEGDTVLTSDDAVFNVRSIYSNYFTLTCYQNRAENNRINKNDHLTEITTISGVLRESCSIQNPSFTIEYDHVPDFNYINIPSFGRYYFVTNITSVGMNLWKLDLTCDVLMSFRTSIMNLDAFIERNEFDFNDDIIDTKRVVEQGADVEVIEENNNIFGTPSYIFTAFGCETYVKEG